MQRVGLGRWGLLGLIVVVWLLEHVAGEAVVAVALNIASHDIDGRCPEKRCREEVVKENLQVMSRLLKLFRNRKARYGRSRVPKCDDGNVEGRRVFIVDPSPLDLEIVFLSRACVANVLVQQVVQQPSSEQPVSRCISAQRFEASD